MGNQSRRWGDHGQQLKSAGDRVRDDILPVLLQAYDEAGPAVVLGLGVVLADILRESGFNANDWQECFNVHDPQWQPKTAP
jgi:hypothetical protein